MPAPLLGPLGGLEGQPLRNRKKDPYWLGLVSVPLRGGAVRRMSSPIPKWQWSIRRRGCSDVPSGPGPALSAIGCPEKDRKSGEEVWGDHVGGGQWNGSNTILRSRKAQSVAPSSG